MAAKRKTRVPLYCDCCGEHLALVNPTELRATPAGRFFEPIDGDYTIGILGDVWPHMTCVHCGKRPFLIPGLYHLATGRHDARKKTEQVENSEEQKETSNA